MHVALATYKQKIEDGAMKARGASYVFFVWVFLFGFLLLCSSNNNYLYVHFFQPGIIFVGPIEVSFSV